MIALDTSALVAILNDESDARNFSEVIDGGGELIIGVPTMLELRMVMAGRIGPTRADAAIETLVNKTVRRVDFDGQHLREAIAAFDRYGKGRHPAALNFGDCMAYAVAAVAGCPLLYKGEDFARTDIRSALTA